MSLIEELSQDFTPPEYAEALKGFNRVIIAKKIGISYGFCSNILSGSRTAGKETTKKLIALSKQVQAELDAVEAGKR